MVFLRQNPGAGNGQVPGCSFILSVVRPMLEYNVKSFFPRRFNLYCFVDYLGGVWGASFAVDSYMYGKPVLPAWRIFEYNVLRGGEHGYVRSPSQVLCGARALSPFHVRVIHTNNKTAAKSDFDRGYPHSAILHTHRILKSLSSQEVLHRNRGLMQSDHAMNKIAESCRFKLAMPRSW